jgi:hypothetical protein
MRLVVEEALVEFRSVRMRDDEHWARRRNPDIDTKLLVEVVCRMKINIIFNKNLMHGITDHI